jgi:Asp-tRNA(Asn)/Glu-tRNA(Gln) amidotransferase B subunit
MGWFVGAVMKKMRGQADAALARQILEELLKKKQNVRGTGRFFGSV